MKIHSNFGVATATADSAAVMSWTFRVAGPVASAAHPAVAAHFAFPAIKRRNAAATLAPVNRGSI